MAFSQSQKGVGRSPVNWVAGKETVSRSISVPRAWYPLLLHATHRDREHWKIAGSGLGIHWPDIDEDLRVESFLRGAPSPQANVLSS